METAAVNGIEICFDTVGDKSDPAVLLIMGLGGQLIVWDDSICNDLADRGFFVIRFDNRDVGLSSHFDSLGAPNLIEIFMGAHDKAPYRLADMAADTVGLLEHLSLSAAHIVGVSMGGMIAQQMAIDHPEVVLSLASIMSTTGDRSVGQTRPEIIAALVSGLPITFDEQIEKQITMAELLSSPGYGFDPSYARDRVMRSIDRANHPVGTLRQLAAIFASGDRTSALGKVEVPTVVIHGDSDPLIDISGGRATAAAIPGARFVEISGMGHEIPPKVWPRIRDEILNNIASRG